MMKNSRHTGGYLLIQVLIFGAVAVVIIGGLVAFAAANAKLGRRIVLSEQAFEIAEAGLEYYRWHLAHAPTDFQDGTGQPGPYVRNFHNKDGIVIGTYTLTIIPPAIGSTIVTVQSVGIPSADTSIRRTIVSRLAIPSFANFAVVADANMRFGEGTEVFGPLHSNGGIRFDGLAHNLVSSGVASYDDPDHNESGTDPHEFGVHTHVNPPPGSGVNNAYRPLEGPPNPVPARPDVFMAGRSFPAPQINFATITTDLIQMKTDAQASGRYFANSGGSNDGYRIVLKTNDTFDLYRVTSLRNPPNGCNTDTWSVNASTLIGNYSFPANGLIFLDDNIWVEGTINTARITIAAAHIPDTGSNSWRNVTINNDIKYTNYDGRDVVALIGQDNINVGLYSEDDLRIDAALIAQNGRVGRFNYNGCGSNDVRDVLTSYGTIVTAERYGFAYVGGGGYTNRNLIYDSFLLFNPPPSFPKTDNFYGVISWKEI